MSGNERRFLDVTWWPHREAILSRANLIGAIFIPGYFDFREERFRAVIGFGIAMATIEQSVFPSERMRCVCVCVCVCCRMCQGGG